MNQQLGQGETALFPYLYKGQGEKISTQQEEKRKKQENISN